MSDKRILRALAVASVLLAGCTEAPAKAPPPRASASAAVLDLPATVEVTEAPAARAWELTTGEALTPHPFGVVVTSARDGWILSVCGECARSHNMRLSRWDGQAWNQTTAPGTRPRAIAASAPDNVWLFGQKGLAWRWDGRQWRTTDWPDPFGPGADRRRWLEAAVVVSADDVWVSGWDEAVRDFTDRRGFLAHRVDGRWVSVEPPGGMVVERFSVLGRDEIWAVARQKTNHADSDADTFHVVRWDGSAWAEIPLPAPLANVRLNDLAAVSGQEIWAVGGIVTRDDDLPVAVRWDGRRWVVPVRPAGRQHLTAVTSDGRGGIWVGTEYVDNPRYSRVLHFDGRRWTYEPTPRPASAPVVSHLVGIPGTDRIVAVGSNPSYDEDATGFIWTRR